MKLFNLAIDSFGIKKNTRLENFSTGLNFVSGPTGSGKSTIRNFVRGILYGFDDDVLQSFVSSSGRPGSIEFQSMDPNQRLVKFSRNISELGAGPLEATDLHTASPVSTNYLANEIDPSTYTSVFNFSFDQHRDQIGRIVHVMRNRLAVPAGRYGRIDRTAYEQWASNQEESKRQIQLFTRQIDELVSRRNRLHSEIENANSHVDHERLARENEMRTLDSQLAGLRQSIGEWLARRHELANDIEALKRRIEAVLTDIKRVPVKTHNTNELSVLYQRLDEIDQHLRRWRSVQSEVQSERLKIRDEMSAVVDVSIESTSHPYHNARQILSNLEAIVGDTEVHAKSWATANVDTTSSAQRAESVMSNCSQMREQLYQLCQELGEQYRHVRHRTAVGELKQLRRCYHEMGESIKRLNHRRSNVLDRIRTLDPAGAEAVFRDDFQFCECAEHEGYLAARRKFVGALPAEVEYETITPDVSVERAQLRDLEGQFDLANSTLHNLESDAGAVQTKLTDLQNRLSSLQVVNVESLHADLRRIENEINELSIRRQHHEHEIQTPAPQVEHSAHPVVEDASTILSRLTDSQLVAIWINESAGSDLSIANRDGVTLPLDAISKTDQVLACLALAIATAMEYGRRNAPTPICYDDLLENVATSRVDNVIRVLDDLCAGGHQVIVFGKHVNSLAKYGMQVNGIHANGLREPLSHSHSVGDVKFFQLVRPIEATPIIPVATTTNFSPVLPAPIENRMTPTDVENVRTTLHSTSNGDSNSSSYDLATFDQGKLLRSTDFFEADYLRALNDSGIHTIADLLDIDPDLMDSELTRRGVSSDLVDRWQSQIWLKIAIPELSANDTLVLFFAGVTDPRLLDQWSDRELSDRIRRTLENSNGNLPYERDRYHEDRYANWRSSFDRNRSFWRNHQRYLRRNRQRRRWAPDSESMRSNQDSRRNDFDRASRSPRPFQSSRNGFSDDSSTRGPRGEHDSRENRSRGRVAIDNPSNETRPFDSASRRASQTTNGTPAASDAHVQPEVVRPQSIVKKQELKFYLNLDDELAAAPSIGPAMAERFEKIGIMSVRDFVEGNAEQMHGELKYKRAKLEDLIQWQQQAKLVCCIPNLRGHDAQLLVACDITDPERIAQMDPASLFSLIGPFSKTKEGQKIVRSGKKPDLDEIKDWISWAQDTRQLQAA